MPWNITFLCVRMEFCYRNESHVEQLRYGMDFLLINLVMGMHLFHGDFGLEMGSLFNSFGEMNSLIGDGSLFCVSFLALSLSW